MKFKSILLAVSLSVAGLSMTGCDRTTLSKTGVYEGNKVLYTADKVLVSAYDSFDSFVSWEYKYRSVLPLEVTQVADSIRANGETWISSAEQLRDAYIFDPNATTAEQLKSALNVVQAALDEAAKYLAKSRQLTGQDAPSPTLRTSPPMYRSRSISRTGPEWEPADRK